MATQTVLNGVTTRRFAAFTLSYTFFFLFVYLLLYSFSHMIQEQGTKAQQTPPD